MDEARPCILLTGVTGFLGKVLLQELVRQTADGRLPQHKVIVLIRDNNKLDASARFEKLCMSKCFSKLSTGWTSNIEVVTGDLTSKDCGLRQDVFARVCAEVTHVLHCAASIDFDLPISEAAKSNISTTLNIMDLITNCPRVQQIVDVSTAYVRPHQPGPIEEELAPLPQPAEELYDSILVGSVDEQGLLTKSGHPNTYTLTKSIAEHLICKQPYKVPVTIVRPSIISVAWRYPFPSWIDSRAALGGYAALFGAGFLHVMEGSLDTTFDVIPVDIVADHIIQESKLSLFEPGDHSKALKIPLHYPKIMHSVAGRQNGLPARTILSTGLSYFGENVVYKRPYWCYMGPRTIAYYWYRFISQTIPLQLASLYYALTRNTSMSRRVALLKRGIATVNKCFPYFCSHTFDFETSFEAIEKFEVDEYIVSIGVGVHQHLLLGKI